MPEHILSLSYGKDSMACFGACELLGWPIDRVVTAEVWATDTLPADLPPMVEFKEKADKIIKDRWGIDVEHISATDKNGCNGRMKIHFIMCMEKNQNDVEKFGDSQCLSEAKTKETGAMLLK